MNPSDCSAPPQDCAGPQLSTMRQLTDADKLRKVICELLETERTYVKVRGVQPQLPCRTLLVSSLLLQAVFRVCIWWWTCIPFYNLCLKYNLNH